jgi:putative DNA primase/helicase
MSGQPNHEKPLIDLGAAIDPTNEADTQPETDAQIIQRLATLSPLEYDRVRADEAKALGVKATALDKQIAAHRKETKPEIQDIFTVADPWPDAVIPADLLDDIADTIRRFIVCPDETADAAALWVSMTWFIDVVQVAPLAVITAPEKRCGKSQLLFILGRLVNRPLTASNITPAALFRSIDLWSPTLLIDEADAFMKDNEELRGLLNCGHTRDSAYIIRTVGDDFTPTRFNVWGAKALAGIGHLSETLMDRAITLELRRKMPHENVDRLRHAEPGLFGGLVSKLARFSDDYRAALREARPTLPNALHDRAQDNWEALLAIAGLAGADWLDRATRAALKLSGSDSENLSVGVELLADIKELFDHNKADKISTADLITALCDDDEKPWATYNRGKPISPRQVSKRLGEYGIKSKGVRIGHHTPKGFEIDQFKEAFNRYLVDLSATPQQTININGLGVADTKVLPQRGVLSATPQHGDTPATQGGNTFNVADNPQRGGYQNQSATLQPTAGVACGGVADKMGEKAATKNKVVRI